MDERISRLCVDWRGAWPAWGINKRRFDVRGCSSRVDSLIGSPLASGRDHRSPARPWIHCRGSGHVGASTGVYPTLTNDTGPLDPFGIVLSRSLVWRPPWVVSGWATIPN